MHASSILASMILILVGCLSTANAAVFPGTPMNHSVQEDPISQQEAFTFAQQWTQAVQKQDFDAVKSLVDWDYIAGQVIEPFDVRDDFREGFMSGAQQLPRQLVPPISAAIGQGGSYQLVNVLKRNNEVHAVFRLVLANDGGLNYHDFRLKKFKGKVYSDQMFIALSGENISETMRRAVLPILKNTTLQGGGMTPELEAALQETESISEMSQAMANGDAAKVLGMYEMLSPEMKRNKLCQIYRISAFPADKNPQQYIKLVDEYAQQFPNDPSLGLMTIDSAIYRQDTEFLKRSHDQLTGWSGKDPYFSLMVGAAMVAMGAKEDGIQLVGDTDPAPLKIANAHDYRLAIDLAKEDYNAVLKQLRILRDQFGMEFGQLEQAEVFAGFVKSPQYQQWLND